MVVSNLTPADGCVAAGAIVIQALYVDILIFVAGDAAGGRVSEATCRVAFHATSLRMASLHQVCNLGMADLDGVSTPNFVTKLTLAAGEGCVARRRRPVLPCRIVAYQAVIWCGRGVWDGRPSGKDTFQRFQPACGRMTCIAGAS